MEVQAWATSPAIVCRPDTPVQSVARMMAEHNVGAVVVVDRDRRPCGIVTDRDLAIRAVVRGVPGHAHIRDVMTKTVVVVRDDEEVAAVVDRMTASQVRRLPVVNAGGAVVGLVSRNDIALAGVEP